ncbi:hypothetical protein SAMN05216226_106197 [Halovenus aranensis]|uniref:Uncharacterized protein n=1 Tax=Halovenus aranensis TaxID=890420 RepID=A0A1G8VFI9_9EURY|nr:hypothetical protein [Halovenus aranensis]SDJ64798.1 hypothetical protein SAMN05216226_106197 [Halovenus aranensis]
MFARGHPESQDIAFGDENWELAGQETARTFIGVDASGSARIKGWNTETICDITEMNFDGPTLHIKTSQSDTKRVDARDFASTG